MPTTNFGLEKNVNTIKKIIIREKRDLGKN